MQRALFVAEKPSLMRKCEEVYDKHKKEIPYEITFLAQRGHLLTLLDPSEMDDELKEWSWDTLPIHPEEHGGWQYKIIKEKKTGSFMTSQERYDVIREELYSGKYDFVINAGDPDQEGELLIRIVLSQLKNKLPIKRFWTNDLTDGKVVDALKNLKDDESDPMLTNLLDAAYGRQHSDYRFGMNLSRAATLQMHGTAACGRVKTPLLAIVCKREEEIRNFKPKTVYGVKVTYEEGFDGTLFSKDAVSAEEKDDEDKKNGIIWFDTKKEAEDCIASLGDKAKVLTYTAKRTIQYAPKLYKLATAQVAAGKIGYNDADTLRIIQGLYEKEYITYPRTDCEYISSHEDMEGIIRELASVSDYVPFMRDITKADYERVRKSKTWVNDKALEDSGHSALCPTTKVPDFSSLSKEEKDIYDLIARQFIAMFMPPCVQDKATLITHVGKQLFRSNGKTLVDPGYTRIFETKHTDNIIPQHEKGDVLDVKEYAVTEKTSTCPKRYTSPELIAVCENPAKFLDDPSLKKSGKKLTIGTPATRSNIIQELIDHNHYIERKKEGKRDVLVPTQKGEDIIKNLGNCDICKVDLTAEWEEKLEMVRSGKLTLDELERGMIEHVNRLVEDIHNTKMTPLPADGKEMKKMGACPICGKEVIAGKKSYFCTGYKEGCKMVIPRVIAGAKITEKDYEALVSGKDITKELTKKDGKETRKWKQRIAYDLDECKLQFLGEKSVPTSFTCPICGKPMMATESRYYCSGRAKEDRSCAFMFPKILSGHTFTQEETEEFLTNGLLKDVQFVSKTGRSFTSGIQVNKEKQGFDFVDTEEAHPTSIPCPKCGANLMITPTKLVCRSGSEEDPCGFRLYRTITGKTLSEEECGELLEKGRLKSVSGLKSKKGNTFTADLVWDKDECKISFDFPEPEKKASEYACPCCGEKLEDDGRTLACSCGFKMWKIVNKKPMEKNDIDELFETGHTRVYRNITAKSGRKFNARLVFDLDKKTTKYEFV